MIDPETEYLMARAKDEAVRAIQAGHPAAADAHQTLSVHYANRAVAELAGEEAPAPGLASPSQPAILPA